MHSRRKILQVAASAGLIAMPWLTHAGGTYSAPPYSAGASSLSPVDPEPPPLYIPPQGFWTQPRFVNLRRLANGQTLQLEYWRDGQIDIEAYRQICWFLRDLRFEGMMARGDAVVERALRAGRVRQEHLTPWVSMDPILIDILYAYSAWLQFHGISAPLDITSAFRHFLTNAMIEGAAQNSQHPKGRAVDIRAPKIPVQALASFGRWLSGGGVGLYVNKDFVHVDSGRVRSWKA